MVFSGALGMHRDMEAGSGMDWYGYTTGSVAAICELDPLAPPRPARGVGQRRGISNFLSTRMLCPHGVLQYKLGFVFQLLVLH